jgi:membrane associated rhomboid family serine protease
MTITLYIIVITSLISWFAYGKEQIFQRFSMQPFRMHKHGEYYRFITSGFLHASFSHLLFNMLSLYFFGSVVEQYFKVVFAEYAPYYFITLYVFAMVIADVPTYFKQRNKSSYSSIGASGSVAAVIFVSIIFQPLQYICFYFVLCLPGFILGIAYLGWSYYQSKNANDHISHEAHLYGSLFGVLFCLVTVPSAFIHFANQLMSWRPF